MKWQTKKAVMSLLEKRDPRKISRNYIYEMTCQWWRASPMGRVWLKHLIVWRGRNLLVPRFGRDFLWAMGKVAEGYTVTCREKDEPLTRWVFGHTDTEGYGPELEEGIYNRDGTRSIRDYKPGFDDIFTRRWRTLKKQEMPVWPARHNISWKE